MTLRPKLPDIGASIFSVMSQLAAEHHAINLSQGFPDFSAPDRLIDLVEQAMRRGDNQYAPMQGIPLLRQDNRVLRFCFAKQDKILEQAAEILCAI